MSDNRTERRYTVEASDGDRLENATRREALDYVGQYHEGRLSKREVVAKMVATREPEG